MSDNNHQSVGVGEAADIKKEFAHEKVFTVEEVAHMLAHVGAASNGNGNGNGSAAAGPHALPPAGVATRLVSGRYEGPSAGGGGEFRLELRVDVDGKRPTAKVSGDLFKTSPALAEGGVGVLRHWGSFLVALPQINVGQDEVTIKGAAEYGPNSKAPIVTVTIPRVPPLVPEPPARVTFSDDAGAVEETFECAFASKHFRTVKYEIDRLEGTEVFESYDTSLFESGGPLRVLTVDAAYAEAGVDMQQVKQEGRSNVVVNNVEDPLEGFDGKWSDSELHSSMLTQFSLLDRAGQEDLGREAQWKLWLLVATEHEQKGMRGIMFDHWWQRHRQGCAVFYNVINSDEKNEDPDGHKRRRGALRTYVHEMGHCFNLVHSWEKSTSRPPMPDRPNSLSYMNYVDRFQGGPEAYWGKFAFEFDDPELLHLRHAFREDIIMGGKAFGTGAAELDTNSFSQPLNDAGLLLKLEARKSFMLCEPVVVELKLYRKGASPRRVHRSIHPDRGFVQLAIRRPDGRVVSYRPLAARCVEPVLTDLDDKQPSIYASAYIGYGKGGFYFEQAGFYQLVAVYYSPCGSEVVSEPLTLRVRNPLNEAEEEIADLYYGHDQGALFYLLGSDSEHLSSGNRSLDNVLDKYPKHSLSVHARLVKGINEGRRFKTVTKEKKLDARDAHPRESENFLSYVVDFMKGGAERGAWAAEAAAPRLDNITLNMCARRLARAQKRLKNKEAAEATLRYAYEYFRRKGLKEHVLRLILKQGKSTLEET